MTTGLILRAVKEGQLRWLSQILEQEEFEHFTYEDEDYIFIECWPDSMSVLEDEIQGIAARYNIEITIETE